MVSSRMIISVTICTWNRALLLDQTLTAMRGLHIPDGVDWELLIVNNACTDNTDEIVAKHARSLPIRLIHESTPGKSHAANRAVDESRGELILWTDDDVLVDADWLLSYVSAAKKFPDVAFYGGSIDPWFEITPPSWIKNNIDVLELVYAIRRAEIEVKYLSQGEWVWGANMAVRRSIHQQFPFDVRIGPCGSNQVRGEEVFLQQKLVGAGYRGAMVGGARVRHYIPAERLCRKYVGGWFRGDGRSSARLEGPQDCVHFMGFPRYALRKYLATRLDHARQFPGSRRWVETFTASAQIEGFLLEAREQHRMASGKDRGRITGVSP